MNRRIISHMLEDILKAIEAVKRFTDQMDYNQFQKDEKTIRAIVRNLR
ncbi:MAG: hypothetical protein MAG581_02363 [Deltaproteobacteria bacterium]|jgi:uncharacterized protein with HEPN domain|nr:hypothetical protein [Deltaproteobacteria bacterium]